MKAIMRLKGRSIHAKLLATYILLVGLGTSLMAGYILWSFYAYFMQARQTDLYNWTSALSESVADALEEQNLQRISVLTTRYGAPDNVALRVFDHQGKLLSTSSPETDQQVTNWLTVSGISDALQNRSDSRHCERASDSGRSPLYCSTDYSQRQGLRGFAYVADPKAISASICTCALDGTGHAATHNLVVCPYQRSLGT
jgi:hypothetical protein